MGIGGGGEGRLWFARVWNGGMEGGGRRMAFGTFFR